MAMFKFMGIVASIMSISPTLSAAETLVPAQSGYRVLEGPVWLSPEDFTFSAVKLEADGRHSKDIGVYLLDLAGLAHGFPSIEGLRAPAKEAEHRPSDRAAFKRFNLILYGNHGSKGLEGAGGDDLLRGYLGADRFVFGARFGNDNNTVSDFD